MSGPVVKVGGVSVPSARIRLRVLGDQGIAGLAQEATGSTAQGAITFDDPTLDYPIRGWQSVTVEVADCVECPRIFTGYVADRRYSHGKYPLGAQIDATLNDMNVLLSMRLIRGAEAKRPEESMAARLAWLIGSDFLFGMVFDLGFVTASVTTFDANDYTGNTPGDVLADLAGDRSQIYFLYWDPDEEKIGLFFDVPDVSLFSSTLSISNDPDDVDDDTIFAPKVGSYLDRTPDEVYDSVYFTYTGGSVYKERAATTTAYFDEFPSPPAVRGVAASNDRVGKATTAANFANSILAHDAIERDTIYLTVRLPEAKVGLIRAGMRVPVKLYHLPGYEDFVPLRVQQLNLYQADLSDKPRRLWDMELVLSNGGLRGAGGNGSGGSGEPPPPGPYVPPAGTHYAAGTFSYFSEGSGTSAGPAAICPGPPNSTVTVTGDATVTLILGVTYNYHFLHTLNSTDLDTGHAVGLNDTGTWNLPHLVAGGGDTTILYEGSFLCNSGNAGTHTVTAEAAGSSHIPKGAAMEWWIDPDGWDSSAEPPSPGQLYPWHELSVTRSGGITSGTTEFPFMTGSLHVKVDGLLISPTHIIEDDNTTGDFHLDWQIDADEVVTVEYQAL